MGEGGSGRSQQIAELVTAFDRFCQRPKSGRTRRSWPRSLPNLRYITNLLERQIAEIAGQFRRPR